MCMGLGHNRGYGLARCLFGCIGWIFDRRSLGSIPVEVYQSSSTNSLLAHSNQNQYCALAWGSCTDCRCSKVLGIHLALKFPLLLELVEMLDLRLIEFCELLIELRYCFGPLLD
jgi:hypothetical protein